jgi:high-affinity Fe2+/Pb2+ permease
MHKKNTKYFVPIILLFVLLNSFFITGHSLLARWNADKEVLIVGNLLLFVVTIISLFVARKGLQSTNPHAFVRAVYGSILVKLFACMIAALIYIAIFKKDLNKPAFFTCMGLYLVYTFMEVAALTRMLKVKNDG